MAIPLQIDFDAPRLRAIARQTEATGQARRLVGRVIYDLPVGVKRRASATLRCKSCAIG
jgi:hypothetical protein